MRHYISEIRNLSQDLGGPLYGNPIHINVLMNGKYYEVITIAQNSRSAERYHTFLDKSLNPLNGVREDGQYAYSERSNYEKKPRRGWRNTLFHVSADSNYKEAAQDLLSIYGCDMTIRVTKWPNNTYPHGSASSVNSPDWVRDYGGARRKANLDFRQW